MRIRSIIGSLYQQSLGDSSLSIVSTVKGDGFNLNQCLKNNLEKEQMQNIPYASAIGNLMYAQGSLMYAQVCTRLDIAFTIRMLRKYQSNLGMYHWRAAKKVMSILRVPKITC